MRVLTILLLLVVVLGACLAMAGCGDDGGGIYCCTYESRSTGCGGVNWNDWETKFYQFNVDDLRDGLTPQLVCDKYTGSDTHCGGSCCIDIQYRNNNLSSGEC